MNKTRGINQQGGLGGRNCIRELGLLGQSDKGGQGLAGWMLGPSPPPH